MGKKDNETKGKTKGKAAPASQAQTAELLPAEVKITDYSHLPVNEQAAFRCKDRIETAAKSANVAFYDMSMGLLEAYENDYPKIWGFENFSDYVEKTLDIKYRSAYYMVEIAKLARKFGIDRDQIERIGWSKMREIASFIQANPEDAQRYLEMAENMGQRQLKEVLSTEVKMKEGKPATAAVMRLSMKLEGDAANMVNDALSMAYGDIGKEDVSLAMQHIAGEWLIARGASPVATSLEDVLSYVERTYGVKLVRAEEADSIDALLAGGGEAVTEDDDKALEDLLASTEDELDELTK